MKSKSQFVKARLDSIGIITHPRRDKTKFMRNKTKSLRRTFLNLFQKMKIKNKQSDLFYVSQIN
jgi:hypothetical protein